jgi:GT2 family glycosyltransferase
MPPSVAIILLNYNSWAYTIACLESLALLDYPNARVIVVDNASPNESVAQLQTYLAQHPTIGGQAVQLIQSASNGGFSAGCNIGLQSAFNGNDDYGPCDYAWLLNNDATVEADSLRPLVQESQRTGGLVGSVVLYPDGRFQQVGTHINWWTGQCQGRATSQGP